MHDHPVSTMMTIDPELTKNLQVSEEFVYADGARPPPPRKMKLLIAMAYDAANGAVNGVIALAAQALNAGATKEEIGEALRVAYLLGGIGSVYVASQGLKELFPE